MPPPALQLFAGPVQLLRIPHQWMPSRRDNVPQCASPCMAQHLVCLTNNEKQSLVLHRFKDSLEPHANFKSHISPCKTWVLGWGFFSGPIKNILKNRETEMTQAVSPMHPLSSCWPQRGASCFETTANALQREGLISGPVV